MRDRQISLILGLTVFHKATADSLVPDLNQGAAFIKEPQRYYLHQLFLFLVALSTFHLV